METNHIKQRTSEDQFWVEETGLQVPFSRVTKLEKMREKSAHKALKMALAANSSLHELKSYLTDISDRIYKEVMVEAEVAKLGKGNFTWFNFDRSIRVEVAINERIDFDDGLIEACRAKLNEFLDENLSDKEQALRDMINDAFQTTKGKLDTKRVLSLLRYRSKIKAKRFQEAMVLLENSIRRPDSKRYIRIAFKDKDGVYQNVDLNFSSI